ncbi:uncharacterized protein [Eurosta solidaginis]|uniref:uncharacterized protein n=1 Tax=Eurosta solidaginis TaxID=178769 RepID=UPI0035316D58
MNSYNFILDGGENGVGSENYILTDISNRPASNQNKFFKEMLNVTKKMFETQQETANKIDQLTCKIDRQGAELIYLRNEIAIIKARICGEAHRPKVVLPVSPLNTYEDFAVLEESLKNEKTFKDLVVELVTSAEKTFDKFIRGCWRQIMTDELAKTCSWRGTDTKKCVRGFLTTLAIRQVRTRRQ